MKTKKYVCWVICGIIYVAIWLIMAFISQPICWLMAMFPLAVIPIYLLRNYPITIKGLCFAVLLFAVYYKYYNGSVLGYVSWSTHDTPINYPAQWFNNYGFYRIMTYGWDVLWFFFWWSLMIIGGYKLYVKQSLNDNITSKN